MSFSHRLRVRVCGLLIENEQLLLLKHQGIGSGGFLWSPPGGGMEFGESAEQTLTREFLEETNLKIKVEQFVLANEYRDDRFHAIELFFAVTKISGELELGLDPELTENDQIIKTFDWFSVEQLQSTDPQNLHNALHQVSSWNELLKTRDFLHFANISIN